MACYNIASIIYLPCGVHAVHRSWMTEFSVAMHNYSGVNHACGMIPWMFKFEVSWRYCFNTGYTSSVGA